MGEGGQGLVLMLMNGGGIRGGLEAIEPQPMILRDVFASVTYLCRIGLDQPVTMTEARCCNSIADNFFSWPPYPRRASARRHRVASEK